MPLDTGTRRRRGSPADEELRSIRTLGRWFVLKTDFTLAQLLRLGSPLSRTRVEVVTNPADPLGGCVLPIVSNALSNEESVEMEKRRGLRIPNQHQETQRRPHSSGREKETLASSSKKLRIAIDRIDRLSVQCTR
jgi:hypothetical protein